MHPHHYTLSLFKHLLDKTEHTLFPSERLEEIKKEYAQLAADPSTSLPIIEATIKKSGREIWPYQEALEELYRRHGKTKEDERLKEKLDPTLRQKYAQFLATGGSLSDFRQGLHTEAYFSPEEKFALGQAVLDAHQVTLQEIASSCRADKQHECEEVIEDHQQKLLRIDKKLAILKELSATSEKWRAEIEDKITAFEEAFGYLTRTFHESDLDGTIDYYQGIIESPEFA